MPKPNLFIIGAAKSGTTSLHDYLAQHPDIFMSEPKEPGFFAPEMTYYPREESWYLSLFDAADDETWIGESSTHYTKLPTYTGVAARIAEYVPNARLIYIMRDPVDRAISYYWHKVRKLVEHKPILKALRDDVEYISLGDYRMQLEPYFEHFPPEQILLLIFEELVDDSSTTLASVLSWLEVEPAAAFELPVSNVRPEDFQRLRGRGLLWRLAKSETWDQLSPLAPQSLKDLGKNLAVEPTRIQPEEVQRARAYLRPIMREKVESLSEFLDRSFPAWTTTLGRED